MAQTTTTRQPKWWTDEHTSAWDRIKESMKRDWEQTKSDLGVKGARDLHQDVGDTVQQAAGKEPIPPRAEWQEAELPLQYGYGGAHHHAKRQWDENVERDLKSDWEANHTNESGGTVGRKWEDVKHMVRHGYEEFISASRL